MADGKLKTDFLKALEDDRTVMLGTISDSGVIARPMTVQRDQDDTDHGVYFFASREEGIGSEYLAGNHNAHLTFQSKGHSLFAAGAGRLMEIVDQEVIDRHWSIFASLYYEDGKRDHNLMLLRFEGGEFDVWRSSTIGFFKAIAGKIAGRDPGEANPEDRGTITL